MEKNMWIDWKKTEFTTIFYLMIVLNADDYRGESQNAYCISEGIEIIIFYSTKNKCIFSREKLKPINDISSLDLDLSWSFSTY